MSYRVDQHGHMTFSNGGFRWTMADNLTLPEALAYAQTHGLACLPMLWIKDNGTEQVVAIGQMDRKTREYFVVEVA